jgi:hypothetical protein
VLVAPDPEPASRGQVPQRQRPLAGEQRAAAVGAQPHRVDPRLLDDLEAAPGAQVPQACRPVLAAGQRQGAHGGGLLEVGQPGEAAGAGVGELTRELGGVAFRWGRAGAVPLPRGVQVAPLQVDQAHQVGGEPVAWMGPAGRVELLEEGIVGQLATPPAPEPEVVERGRVQGIGFQRLAPGAAGGVRLVQVEQGQRAVVERVGEAADRVVCDRCVPGERGLFRKLECPSCAAELREPDIDALLYGTPRPGAWPPSAPTPTRTASTTATTTASTTPPWPSSATAGACGSSTTASFPGRWRPRGRLRPDDAHHYDNRSLVLERLGRHNEARAARRRARELRDKASHSG